MKLTIQQALETLELDVRAEWTDVQRSYRDLIRVWHPDRFASDARLQKKTEEQAKLLNGAYQCIIELGEVGFKNWKEQHREDRTQRKASSTSQNSSNAHANEGATTTTNSQRPKSDSSSGTDRSAKLRQWAVKLIPLAVIVGISVLRGVHQPHSTFKKENPRGSAGPVIAAPTLIAAGWKNIEENKYTEAIKSFEVATNLVPNNSEAFAGIATALLGIAKNEFDAKSRGEIFAKARQKVSEAIAVEPQVNRETIGQYFCLLSVIDCEDARFSEASIHLDKCFQGSSHGKDNFGYVSEKILKAVSSVPQDEISTKEAVARLTVFSRDSEDFISFVAPTLKEADNISYHLVVAFKIVPTETGKKFPLPSVMLTIISNSKKRTPFSSVSAVGVPDDYLNLYQSVSQQGEEDTINNFVRVSLMGPAVAHADREGLILNLNSERETTTVVIPTYYFLGIGLVIDKVLNNFWHLLNHPSEDSDSATTGVQLKGPPKPVLPEVKSPSVGFATDENAEY